LDDNHWSYPKKNSTFAIIMSDFTSELKKLHELSGAEFSRQVERIARRKEFHPLDTDSEIFTLGGEKSDDYQRLLVAARKAVDFGYRVYFLPNPTGTRTPDFILVKKGVYRTYDLKTVFGKASIGDSLIDSIGQCNRILINMTREYNTRRLAYAIKRYFEISEKAVEVLIFKGGKHISVKRVIAIRDDFFSKFKKV
jgi:hypothetical protein